MTITAIKVPGKDAISTLMHHRLRFSETRHYPFLIGDNDALRRVQEAGEFNERDPEQIIQASRSLDTAAWIASRRADAEEYEFSSDETLGDWPGEIADKGSIGMHKDILTGKIKPEVYLGLVTLDQAWQLPAILKYGAWNDCPEPEIHCAFHRRWQAEYGAEITGVSGDVVECTVASPPTNREAALRLAWQQYWYCTDIVEQGCGSVANLAATLLNSQYWYFWWD